MTKKKAAVFKHAITCDLCGEHFADEDTFDAHQRPEPDRHVPTSVFLYRAKLDKCYSPGALWVQGWSRHRTEQVWTKPAAPKRRPHRINPDDTYQCLLCKKIFDDVTPFLAHHILTFTPAERCLDQHELLALNYERKPNGVWRATAFTQMLPSQAARLPSVRLDAEAAAKAEGCAVPPITGKRVVHPEPARPALRDRFRDLVAPL